MTTLWKSGRTGVIVLSTVAAIALANAGGETEEQAAMKDAEVPANVGSPLAASDRSHASPAEGKTAKIKTVGFWVCTQCGTQLESRIRPTGRCPSRTNAPHAWVKKGETQVVDYGQKKLIWQCRKCFQVLTLPGGAPPSGMRCPKEKNAPHGWDKIGEQ